MKITVNGSISQFLKGLPEVKPEVIIGLPINDSKGNRIGTITEIDKDTDLWTGIIEAKGELLCLIR